MSTVRSAAVVALALVMIGAGVLHGAPASLTVEVDKPGVKISPTLWGIFFEDINLSADGGIYPELVRNRSFEDSDQPDHWTLNKAGDDKSEMAIDTSRPLDPMNRQSLRVKLDGSADAHQQGLLGHERGQGRDLPGASGRPGRRWFQRPHRRVLAEGGQDSCRGRPALESRARCPRHAGRQRSGQRRDHRPDGPVERILARSDGRRHRPEGATEPDRSPARARSGSTWSRRAGEDLEEPRPAARPVRDARRPEAGVRALPRRLLGRRRRHGAHVPLEEHHRRRSGIASRCGTSGSTGPRTAWATTSTSRCARTSAPSRSFVHQRRHVAPRA